MPDAEQDARANVSTREEFLNRIKEDFEKTNRELSSQLVAEENYSIGLHSMAHIFTAWESVLDGRDEVTARVTESYATFLKQAAATTKSAHERKLHFQEHFDKRTSEAVLARVEAFSKVASYQEKLIVLGLGALGLSGTLLGVFASHASRSSQLHWMPILLLGWLAVGLAIAMGIHTQLAMSLRGHRALNKLADAVTKSALARNDVEFPSASLPAYRTPAEQKTTPPLRFVNERSPAWQESERIALRASWSTWLLLAGYGLLLIFLVKNLMILTSTQAHAEQPLLRIASHILNTD